MLKHVYRRRRSVLCARLPDRRLLLPVTAEYKRQTLNLLSVIHRWDTLKRMSEEERHNVVKRTVIFAGKVPLLAGRHQAPIVRLIVGIVRLHRRLLATRWPRSPSS